MNQNQFLYKLQYVTYFILKIVTSILLVRFALKLLGANAAAGFTQFIYALSAPLMVPFQYVFPTEVIQGSIIEWTVLLAILIYWGIAEMVLMLFAAASHTDRNISDKQLEANV